MVDSLCVIDYPYMAIYDYSSAIAVSPSGTSMEVVIVDHLPNTEKVMVCDFNNNEKGFWYVGDRCNLPTREKFYGPFKVREAMIVHLLLLLDTKRHPKTK